MKYLYYSLFLICLWLNYRTTLYLLFLSCPGTVSIFLPLFLSVFPYLFIYLFIYWCIKVSIAIVNTMTKSILGRKRFISSLKTLGLLYYWRNSGQELIQRGNGGTLLAGLACSAWLLIAPRTTYLPRGGTSHSGLGPPSSVINQQNASQSCSQANQVGAFSQSRFPLLK